jgi:phosphopantothenoylcysteine synthetase/decarboxylase
MNYKMHVILGVSGGIAAYKSCDVISGLRSKDFDVRVIMTDNAKQFITPMTLSTLSRHPVMDNMWAERDGKVEHIDVAKWGTVFVVYPATCNIIAKFANGIADDLLSTVYLALPSDVIRIVFPAMNTNMLNNPVTQRNLEQLKRDGVLVQDTRETELACGDIGKGGVLKARDAVAIIGAAYSDLLDKYYKEWKDGDRQAIIDAKMQELFVRKDYK